MLKVETYFEESVQGLLEGSKVRMRGVAIGTVDEIGFVSTYYSLPDDLEREYGRWILVRASIDPNAFEGQSLEKLTEVMNQRIKAGLRARMASAGLTGAKYIDVDRLDPVRFPAFVPPWKPDRPYVPSAKGVFSTIVSSVDYIVEQVKALDIDSLLADINAFVRSADEAVSDARIPELRERVDVVLDDFHALVKDQDIRESLTNIREASESAKMLMADLQELLAGERMDKAVDDLAYAGEQIRDATDRLPSLVARLDRTVLNMDRLITSESEDVQALVMELRITIQNLRELTELAKRYPSSVLFGEQPPQKDPEELP